MIMDDELERMWKEESLDYFKALALSQNYLG
jgi:hypothetical protein